MRDLISNVTILSALGFIAATLAPSAFAQTTDPFAQTASPEEQVQDPFFDPFAGVDGQNPPADQMFFPENGPGNNTTNTANEGNAAFPAQQNAFSFEKSPDELEEEFRKEAFDAALQGLLPLRPEEIRTLLERYDRTQESVNLPVYPNPKPEFTVQNISLDPGTKPVSVKVSHGHVTTINFLDSTGSPWPIEDITWAGDFQIIESSPGENANILRVTPQSQFAFGNMSIKMIGLQTPVILVLETSRDIVHYRFDAILPDSSPMGKTPLIKTGVSLTAGDPDMTSILEGIIPPGAQRMDVAGVDSRTSAYNFNGMTILRTPHALLSPAWDSSVSSADGTHVYAFRETPVVLLSQNGKMTRAKISTRQDALEDLISE